MAFERNDRLGIENRGLIAGFVGAVFYVDFFFQHIGFGIVQITPVPIVGQAVCDTFIVHVTWATGSLGAQVVSAGDAALKLQAVVVVEHPVYLGIVADNALLGI